MSTKESESSSNSGDPRKRLGAALRQIRVSAGLTLRKMPKYSDGHFANVENGVTIPSIDVIKVYAEQGGDYAHLVYLLQKAKERKGGTSDEPGSDSQEKLLLDPRTDPHLLRLGYTVDIIEDISYVGPDKVLTKDVQKVSIRPLSNNAKYFPFRYAYDHDLRRGVSSVQAGSGCDLEFVEENDSGILYAVLKFNPHDRDSLGRCSFSWTITINSDVPIDPCMRVVTKSHVPHIIKRSQFSAPAVPQKIWTFRGFDPFNPMLDPASEQLLPLNSTQFYFSEFYDVQEEGCGLAWQWA